MKITLLSGTKDLMICGILQPSLWVDIQETIMSSCFHSLREEIQLVDKAVLLVPVASELLILSLDLVKSRVVVMGAEMRKAFIGTVLVGLIEKSPDIKIMKAITKVHVSSNL